MSLSTRQLHAIEVTERLCSCLSLLGTSFIISTFLTNPQFRKPINRLVFFASWGNVLANVGTLISRSALLLGPNTPLCQLQGFLIQMFLPADACWTLAMACNVYLTFFHKYNAQQLRKLEWKYITFCYGGPLIPSFVYFFISNPERGRIYGSATLWCWVSIKWDFLRIAVFYGPVWLMIVIIFSIYIYAGKEIFQKRSQLRSFNVPPPFPILENPFVSCKTTEIKITSELADLPTLNASQISFKMDPNGRIQSTQGYDQYSVTIETAPRPGPARPTASAASSHDTTYHHRTAAMEANTAAWSYTKCALLFFASLLITWVPSTVNRVYSLAHPEVVSFPLNYASALVLPLQGWWNFVVYVTTSFPATKALLRKIAGLILHKDFSAPHVRARGVRTYPVAEGLKKEGDNLSGTDSRADSMTGFVRSSQNYAPMDQKHYPLSP